ncbi:MAG: carboxylating nicotinate-nucleotide diphosphorylase [Chloroflexi bacterium]|nr:carboxylating nicotinate-nucleotide diphosphorylase [Chloroflexota bacterium]
MDIPYAEVQAIVKRALAEDLAWGDITTEALPLRGAWGRLSILVKEEGVLAGIHVLAAVFQAVDGALKVNILSEDGTRVKPGDIVVTVEGAVPSLLAGERVALNFLGHLSGIATQTAHYVASVKGLPVRIVDTRKTTPGLRALEKYAVRMGGGFNHRYNLSDGVLIKDNHLSALRAAGFGLGEVIRHVRERAPHTLQIEVEVETVEEAEAAVEAGADIVLLDNMSVKEMAQAVRVIAGRALVEASGGVTLETIRSIAETGVNIISVGALTHSVRALDISAELILEI